MKETRLKKILMLDSVCLCQCLYWGRVLTHCLSPKCDSAGRLHPYPPLIHTWTSAVFQLTELQPVDCWLKLYEKNYLVNISLKCNRAKDSSKILTKDIYRNPTLTLICFAACNLDFLCELSETHTQASMVKDRPFLSRVIHSSKPHNILPIYIYIGRMWFLANNPVVAETCCSERW